MAEPIEQATGDEKIMLLLEERGIDVGERLQRWPTDAVSGAGPLLHEADQARPRDEGQP